MTASPGGNNHRRVRQLGIIEREPQNLSTRSIGARQQIECVVPAQVRRLDLIAELRDLLPTAVRSEQIMRKIAAVAVRYGGQNKFSVARRLQLDLCNARKVFA